MIAEKKEVNLYRWFMVGLGDCKPTKLNLRLHNVKLPFLSDLSATSVVFAKPRPWWFPFNWVTLSKPGEILSHLELSRSPVHAYKLRWAFTSTSRGVACAKLWTLPWIQAIKYGEAEKCLTKLLPVVRWDRVSLGVWITGGIVICCQSSRRLVYMGEARHSIMSLLISWLLVGQE